MDTFKDKMAIVTGGAAGIGRELCYELARYGARVVVADINRAGAEETAETINRDGGWARAENCDMRKSDAVKKLIKRVLKEGPLDYMFNNAGIIMFGEFRDMGHDDWKHFIESDIWSVINGTMSSYAVMIEQGFGHIINVSSVFGLFPFALATGYAAVKHAVVGFSLSLRPEAKDFGVRISVACPGSVETEMKKSYTIFNADRDVFNSYIMKQITPEKAAQKIIKGVKRNKGLIAFPSYDLIPWWLYRIHPSMNNFWQRKMVKLFREKARYSS